MTDLVDYVEGFIVLNEQSLHSSSTAFPTHIYFTSEFHSRGRRSKIYYCIEFAVHDFRMKNINTEQVVEEIARQMNHLPSHLYSVEVSYYDFLNRVRMEEMSLRSIGLWEVPHPWLNMFVPKPGIKKFTDLLLENISPDEFEGPILIYPILRDKWDTNMSVVLPEAVTADEAADDRVIYIVGMLRSANPASCSAECLRNLLRSNHEIAVTASGSIIGAKQYIPHHPSPADWRDHFGLHWDRFAARKARFDPLSILAPGQGIFPRISASSL